jgi:hypothetical protein
LLCVAGCQRAPVAESTFTIRHKPPERKDVIEAAMASHDVPLSVNSSCANVGTTQGDATIGAYLAGFLAELAKPGEKNWLEAKVASEKDATGAAVWRCEMTIRHSAGEDEWGWGVRFDIRQSDGRVVPASFVCTGAG